MAILCSNNNCNVVFALKSKCKQGKRIFQIPNAFLCYLKFSFDCNYAHVCWAYQWTYQLGLLISGDMGIVDLLQTILRFFLFHIPGLFDFQQKSVMGTTPMVNKVGKFSFNHHKLLEQLKKRNLSD